MTNQQFQIGSQVQLKSGGPIMVIEEVENDTAYVVWFDKNEVKREQFNVGILSRIA
ncbi:MAG: YodC family protein [Cypionkella sp.]